MILLGLLKRIIAYDEDCFKDCSFDSNKKHYFCIINKEKFKNYLQAADSQDYAELKDTFNLGKASFILNDNEYGTMNFVNEKNEIINENSENVDEKLSKLYMRECLEKIRETSPDNNLFLVKFDKTVEDIMTRTPKTVSPLTKITEIQRIMQRYKVHSVLVVDDEQHLLGIVDHYSCMI